MKNSSKSDAPKRSIIDKPKKTLANNESRTVSNMAKVLIQEGIKKYFEEQSKVIVSEHNLNTDNFRDELEKQTVRRLKRAPQRIRYFKKSD